MIGTAEGLARGARTSAFTVASAVLALGAHVLGGGAPPGVTGTAAVLAVSAATAGVVGRRARGLPGNLAVLTAVQFLLHELLAVTGPEGGDARAASPVAGAEQAGMPGTTGMTGMGHHAHPASDPVQAAGSMLATHLLALILTALLLARGERLVDGACRALTAVPRLLTTLVRPPLPAPLRPTLVRSAVRPPAVLPVQALHACAPVVRRGPPAPVC